MLEPQVVGILYSMEGAAQFLGYAPNKYGRCAPALARHVYGKKPKLRPYTILEPGGTPVFHFDDLVAFGKKYGGGMPRGDKGYRPPQDGFIPGCPPPVNGVLVPDEKPGKGAKVPLRKVRKALRDKGEMRCDLGTQGKAVVYNIENTGYFLVTTNPEGHQATEKFVTLTDLVRNMREFAPLNDWK